MASIGKFLKTSTLALASLALFACAHGNDKKGEAEHPKEAELPVAKKSAPDAGSSIEAKQVAAEEEATYVAEIKFPKTKSTLTANDKERLKKIFDQAAAKGQIEDIKSVAWADSEYPSVHTKKLPTAERLLADHRNQAIETYFKELNGKTASKFSAYNMAERPNAVAEMLGTPNARIKKSLEVAGIPNTDTSNKTPSKASKAIVMIILKN